MVPQLQFQARAALMFGELHDSIPMDRVRGISYQPGPIAAPGPGVGVAHLFRGGGGVDERAYVFRDG
jgi:hypothetical protein